MNDSVLFSCVGTSDPVRGMHDGGMLHIMRHYRPKKVYIFLSKEVEGFEAKDHRIEKTFQYVNQHWENYSAEKICENSGLVNVADMDVVFEPLCAFFDRAIRENPDSQMLINLSSGTPQMKTVLAQLAISSRHKDIKGIQVSNPEESSGKTSRTNDKDYDVDVELECNDDESPDAPNRCSEPKLFAIQRDRIRAQMRSLLERRDYRALEALDEQLPPTLLPLIRHLAARNDLQTEEAYKLSRDLSMPFKLYPAKRAGDKEYRELSEYYLLLRNLQMTKRYSEFVLRMNPFLTKIIVRQLERTLPNPERIVQHKKNGNIILNMDNLRSDMPEETSRLEQMCGKMLDNRDISLAVSIPLLRVLNQLPEHILLH